MKIEWMLKDQPYDVQKEAMKRSAGKLRYGYFMEMGLGKTATTLNDYVNLLRHGEVSRMIVVCPMSLKTEWRAQAEIWDEGRYIKPVIWPNKSKGKLGTMQIMNIEALIGSGGDYLERFLEAVPDTLFVVDESIMIKNPKALRTKRALQLAAMASHVRILSGAPMVNSPLDLWAQLKILRANYNKDQFKDTAHPDDPPVEPNYKLNPYAFRNRYCIMGGFKNKKVVGIKNDEQLRSVIDSVSFTAKKKDWTDLPPELHTKHEYTLSLKQQKHYKEMQNDMVTEIDGEVVTARMVITKMMKLQQISSGFIYDEYGNEIFTKDNSKIKLLKEIRDTIPNKVIIFAHFKASIDLIMEKYHDTAVCIRGGMTPDEIDDAKRQFNEGSAREIVCQAASAKYGHTLLGTEDDPCHTAFYYENDYNLDTRIQAEARAHRHGQKYPVTSIDLIGTPVEEVAINALVHKRSVADSIVQASKKGEF